MRLALLLPAIALLALVGRGAKAEDVVVRVTAEEQPVENATVKVLKADEDLVFDRTRWAPDKLTDESGLALVNIGKGGKVLVYVPGYAVAVATADRLPLDIELKPERIYAGLVVDTKGDPVAGIPVALHTTFHEPARFPATTDKKGRFFVYGLWLDAYSVTIKAPGFLPVTGRGPRFELTRVASLAGVVIDADGKPLPGVLVHVATTNEDGQIKWNAAPSQRSGAKGAFRFEDLAPWWFRLAPAVPHGGHADVELREGEDRKDFRVIALAPATLTIKVVDEKGEPLEKVAMEETGHVTDAKGSITFVVPPGYPELERELTRDGFESETITFGPEKPGVTRDLETIVLIAHKPADVTVLLPNGKPAQAGTVGGIEIKNGKATVPSEGSWTVRVPGYAKDYVYAPGSVTLLEPLWIEGEVRDAEGKPIEGVQVIADDRRGLVIVEPEPAPKTTKADGRFRFGPYPPGTISIEAKKAGYRDYSVEVTLSAGSLVVILTPAPPPELLVGSVTRDGIPVQDFSVDGERFMNGDGRFEVTIDRAKESWVSVYVNQTSYAYALPPTGQPLEVRLPTGRITVKVTGVDGPWRVALSHGNRSVMSRDLERDGTVHFDGLDPGEYTVGAGDLHTTARAKLGETVRLRRLPAGTFSVRMPPGMKPDEPLPGPLPVGRHFFGASQGEVWIYFRFDIKANAETAIDLTGSGEVLIHGEREDDAYELARGEINYRATMGETGRLRFTHLPAGDYTLKKDLVRRLVRVTRGAITEVTLKKGQYKFSGVIRVGGGRPAQGAKIEIVPATDTEAFPEGDITDVRGRFHFEGLSEGEYLWRVEHEGYAVAKGSLTIAPGGTLAPGFPLVLKKGAGVRIRVLGVLGRPISAVARMDGETLETDRLGYLVIDRVPATISIEMKGYASIRGYRVTGPAEIRLERGADLVVLLDPEAGELEIRIGGRVWELPKTVGARLVLRDLPPGPLQVTQSPIRDEEGDTEGEGEPDEEQPKPQIVQTKLISGEQITVDLRD